MTTLKLCLVHDRKDDNLPPSYDRLSGLGTVKAVRLTQGDRLARFATWPWLVDLDWFGVEEAATLRRLLHIGLPRPRIIAVPPHDRRAVVQALSVGATDVVPRPVDADRMRLLIATSSNAAVPGNKSTNDPIRATLFEATEKAKQAGSESVRQLRTVGEAMVRHASDETGPHRHVDRVVQATADVLTHVLSEVLSGKIVTRGDWNQAARAVFVAVEGHGLREWLDRVRFHHVGTFQHSLLAMGVASAFGRMVSLDETTCLQLTLGALLHDIGKCWVSENILSKPGKLDNHEFDLVRCHPHAGWHALQSVEPLLDDAILDIVLHHHELLDGSGYPDGLAGSAIVPLTRMMTVCDVYAALIERRAYRPPLTRCEAVAILDAMVSAGKLDAGLVGAIAKLEVDDAGVGRRSVLEAEWR